MYVNQRKVKFIERLNAWDKFKMPRETVAPFQLVSVFNLNFKPSKAYSNYTYIDRICVQNFLRILKD